LAKAPKKFPVDYVAKIAAFRWNNLADLWTKVDRVPRKGIGGWAKGKALEHLIPTALVSDSGGIPNGRLI
jgi:hypothetical protein